MELCDFHIHTVFSDGADAPAAIAEEAVARGLTAIGFSDHSYLPFDSGCLKKDGADEYLTEIRRVKKLFSGKLEVLCGIEQDYFSGIRDPRLDYAIGSVHYIEAGGGYVPVDLDAASLTDAAGRYFGGDMTALCVEYFKTAAKVIDATGADVIGHFDLIRKFNGNGELFDSRSVRYREAWRDAADKLISLGKPFEINTGAISRGVGDDAYPSREIADYIYGKGGKFILSGDSHRAKDLCFSFDVYRKRYGDAILTRPVSRTRRKSRD